jgi:hypothetical protein
MSVMDDGHRLAELPVLRADLGDRGGYGGLYEDLRPVRFHLESARAGQAVVAQQDSQ